MIVAFDLDGTLIDSARDVAVSANELVVGLGGTALDIADITKMIGDGAGVLVKRALSAGGLDPETPGALAQFLDIYDRRLLETTVSYLGVRETLTQLAQRARLAVLTNKPLSHSHRVLEGLKLSAFFDVVIGGDGAFRKPDPGGMLSLMALEPGATRTAALVGDSPVDCETARAAGCHFVWARYGFGAARFDDLPETPYVIDRPIDLVALLDNFA